MNRRSVLAFFSTILLVLPVTGMAETGASCVSVTDSTIGEAAGGAVLVMFGVLAGMFTAVGLFVLKLARGARDAAQKPAAHAGL